MYRATHAPHRASKAVLTRRLFLTQAVNSRKGAFTERDEQLLSLFAMHLGTSLSLARLHTWTRCAQHASCAYLERAF